MIEPSKNSELNNEDCESLSQLKHSNDPDINESPVDIKNIKSNEINKSPFPRPPKPIIRNSSHPVENTDHIQINKSDSQENIPKDKENSPIIELSPKPADSKEADKFSRGIPIIYDGNDKETIPTERKNSPTIPISNEPTNLKKEIDEKSVDIIPTIINEKIISQNTPIETKETDSGSDGDVEKSDSVADKEEIESESDKNSLKNPKKHHDNFFKKMNIGSLFGMHKKEGKS